MTVQSIPNIADQLDKVHDMLKDSFPRDESDPQWKGFHQAKIDELGDLIGELFALLPKFNPHDQRWELEGQPLSQDECELFGIDETLRT